MRTRDQSKPSTGETDSKKPKHECRIQDRFDSIDDKGPLTAISQGSVGKLLNRVNKRKSAGSKKQDSSFLAKCDSITKLGSGSNENIKVTIHTNDTNTIKNSEIEDESLKVKVDEDDEMNGSDWEDGSIPTLKTINNESDNNNIDNNLTIEFDASPSDSAKKKPVRRASAEEKELAELVHKIHLLCLLGRGRLIDSACNDPLIQAAILSLLPAYLHKISEVSKLTANHLAALVNWFHTNFRTRSPNTTAVSLSSALACAIESREGTSEEVAALSVALFRALNLTTRFVSILDVTSIKPDPEKPEQINQERSKKGKGIFNSSTLMVDKSTQRNTSPAKKSTSARQLFDETYDSVPTEVKSDISGSKRKGDIEFEMELQMALSATSASSSKKDTGLEAKASDSNSPKTFSSPFKRLKKVTGEESSSSPQGISTAFGSRKVGPPLYWAEVYCSGENLTGKWVHVDAVNAIIDGEMKVEAAVSACKTPLRYAVAFSGHGAKDVTRRYCMKWYKIAPQRVNSVWWDQVLAPLKELESRTVKDDVNANIEDMELQTRALIEPLPTNQQAYRSHPLYAIEKWLTKNQTLHPKGPILGLCSGHPVYPRTCVQTLHTKQRWLREGLQIKSDELPVKVLKKPAKSQVNESDDYGVKVIGGEISLYGKWQTEPLCLPRAVDGIVPKNEMGQVDVWSEKCLPPGTVHLRFPQIFNIAKRFGIDYAPAMVGFDFKNGRAVPVYNGIVVCSEFKDTILEAYGEEEERRLGEERKKNESQAISRWYQLLSSIVTRQRLASRYADSLLQNDNHVPYKEVRQKQPNKTNPIVVVQESRSRNRFCAKVTNEEEHEHVFIRDDVVYDEDYGSRTKKCRCGFSVEVEEL